LASKPPASLPKGNRSDCACAPSGRERGLGERLLDANRTLGQPDKLTTIFGHKVTKSYRGKLETEIQNMHLPNPGNPRPIPQRLLQTICARPFHPAPALRTTFSAINDNYLNVQQDILETFVDRGQLQRLAHKGVHERSRRSPPPLSASPA